MSAMLWQKLKRLLYVQKPELNPEQIVDKKTELHNKYISFKQLLDANNNALKAMNELEGALRSSRPFGMVFISGQTSRASISVFSMISHLNALSGNKYRRLEPIFKDIEAEIKEIIEQKHVPSSDRLIISLSDINKNHTDLVGSKMAVLGELSEKFPELNVPKGFVITSAGYNLLMENSGLETEIQRLIRTALIENQADLYRTSSKIQMLIINTILPEALARAIKQAYSEFEKQVGFNAPVAMRSSAVGEDETGTSFAGQYKSELNVTPENIFSVYKEIIAAKYSVTAMSYRNRMGIPDELVPMCVGCMEMIRARCGGVAYSRDPLNMSEDRVIVSAVPGLPKPVVDGSLTPDRYVFTGENQSLLLEKKVNIKPFRIEVLPTEGIKKTENSLELSSAPSLTDEQARLTARTARLLEEYFKTPVDMEWAFDHNGLLVTLQARPLAGADTPKGLESQAPDEYRERLIIQGGETACKGSAFGKIFHVKDNQDMLQFPENSIMVTRLALPRWASVLSRASGVITEQGSVTGHLGSVAREFSVPAIFGLKNSMDKLENGLEITMDADGKRVYRGEIKELSGQKVTAEGIMQGTKIHKILTRVLKFITPLHLTDPDSVDFRPGNCRSLHDITRFCHEKAVHEMFEMGNITDLSQSGGKRLVVDVPMQWWVLDLEDGFKEPVEGKNVHISNINSLPMLALWKGITAMTWEGPPPMDGRGFMSVMVQATSNPDLSDSGPSIYANKNYFMISRYFCNLTSRMGFHFSTVETLVGDKAYENYARFSFKGGAADMRRRKMRTGFIAEILKNYDFQVESYDDSIFARIRGGSDEFMVHRLQILGYLTIHTRQLDMIMLSQEKVSYYYEKIIRDIERIFPIN